MAFGKLELLTSKLETISESALSLTRVLLKEILLEIGLIEEI